LGPEKPRGGYHVWGMRGRILEYGRICFNSLRFSGIRFGPEHGAEPILHSGIRFGPVHGAESILHFDIRFRPEPRVKPFFSPVSGSDLNTE